MAIRIPIISDFSDAGVKAASKSFGDLQSKAKGLGASLPLIGIAMAGIGAASTFIYKAVQAAADDQKSQALLERQLKQTLNANDLLVASMERYVSKAQLATEVTDTQLRAGLATLVRATGSATEAQDLLNLSMDISAATGKDLDSVNMALAKAANGNTTALTKLGIPLDETAVKTKDLTAITKSLNDQFGGAAATAANTFQGKIKILKGQLGEIGETIGAALLPYLDQFATFLVKSVAPAVERITSVIGEHGLVAGFQQLVFESGKAGPAIIGVVKGITIAFANLINIVYKAVQIQIAQFKILKGDLGGALDALKKAAGNFIDVGALEKNFDRIAFGFDYASNSAMGLVDVLDEVGNKVLPKTKEALGAVEEEIKKTGSSADGMKKRIEEARKELSEQFTAALDASTKKLQEAQSAYDDFKNTVSESVTGEFSISGAADAAQEAGTTILAQLNQQASGAKQFSKQVEQLLTMGLSEDALRKVLEAGQEAGSSIANELILGGSEAITGPNGINTLVSDLNFVADALGTLAADKFFAAGVTQGEQYLAGVQSAIQAAEQLLKNPNLKLADVKGIGAKFASDVAGINTGAPASASATLAPGGNAAARGGNNYTVNINGGVMTNAQTGKVVIDAVKSFNRASGPADIAVRPISGRY
jgi:hypothetical protein